MMSIMPRMRYSPSSFFNRPPDCAFLILNLALARFPGGFAGSHEMSGTLGSRQSPTSTVTVAFAAKRC